MGFPALNHDSSTPDYLKNFSPSQLEIILSSDPVKQIVAAAGSGKTRTVIGLTEYYLKEYPSSRGKTLLLSFSRKAVEELTERLPEELRPQAEISTFHAFCLRHLKSLYPRYFRKLRIFTDEDKKKFFLKILQKQEIREEIGGIPFDLLYDKKYILKKKFPEIYQEIENSLKKHKRKHSLMEFEDLIEIMIQTLGKKSNQVLSFQKKYKIIIVDEFQDTDSHQLKFLQLMKPSFLVVVGDDWQAIYGFRGASLAPFLNFRKIFGAKIYRLSDNYRSLHNIVELGNHIIRFSKNQIPKKVLSVRSSQEKFPVLTLCMDTILPSDLASLMSPHKQEFRLLVRTNRQAKRWKQDGFSQENILTIHKSKGLEFPIVLLDLCGGWSSSGSIRKRQEKKKFFSSSFDEIDEEIRVLYVGASRAINILIVLFQPEYLAGINELYFFKKLIQPKAQSCPPEALSKWLDKMKKYL